jgi:hypothetical protein
MAKEVWRWWKETGVCADAQTVNEKGKIENKLTVLVLVQFGFKEKVIPVVF